ncbi:transposase, partial [Nonomuraea fuscirosea]
MGASNQPGAAQLHLPEHTWLVDPGRCRAAGVPDETAFATKPALATTILLAALQAGVQAAWATGDEVNGQDPPLRAALEARRTGYVLAIAGNRRVELQGVVLSAAEVAAPVADRHWHRYRAGQSAKGPRWHAWALARIDEGQADGYPWLLIRRNLTTGELAFYRYHAPDRQPLMALVKIAGIRWAVEESFKPPRARSAWTTTRCAAGHPGTGTSLSPCSPWPLLAAIAAAQPPTTGRPHPAHPARDPPAPGRTRADPAPLYRTRSTLVKLAPTPPSNSPTLPLPAQIRTMIAKCHWSTRSTSRVVPSFERWLGKGNRQADERETSVDGSGKR